MIVEYSISPTPDRHVNFEAALGESRSAVGRLHGKIIADAGCWNEQDYAYLEGEALKTTVKYNINH
ncbi:hypothetical protein [Paenibacillus ihumii]|uniref:hypothetical protein n=1 Tax=Paenibacillus ihumii TaxID=687436 RepID=UPI0011DCE2D4|nr:hypothetical protein [Paenibacillus ihumii]